VNINLIWGIVMILFGLGMLGLAWHHWRQERHTPNG
jgi:hypothetical protein